ncbi:hypothetical protein [Rhodococcus koreensis]|uniref:hypothetical protein n=1 Tax=Rhodococcus koreensis TaxID=99653 RepID=UPI0036716B60
MVWDRTRHTQPLRHALREYFPAALEAFDRTTSMPSELLGKALGPAAAALGQIAAALRNARRRDIEQLGRAPPPPTWPPPALR